MKPINLIIFLFLSVPPLLGQQSTKGLGHITQNTGQNTGQNVEGREQIEVILEKAASLQYNQVDSAIFYAELAKERSDSLGDCLLMAKSSYRLGSCWYVKGSYVMAMQHFYHAMEIFKEMDDQTGIALSLSGLGLVSLGQQKYEESLAYHQKSLNLHLELADSAGIAKNYFNIGLCHDELGQYKKAHQYLDKSAAISKATGYWQILMMSDGRKGEVYYHQGKYDSALIYYNNVLQLEGYESKWEYAFANSGKAQTFVAMGDYRAAIDNAILSLGFAKEVNAHWDAERAARILAHAYEKVKDYENAYRYHAIYKAYSDSLYNEAKERGINALKLAQKELENEQLTKDKILAEEKVEKRNLLSILLGVLLISFTVFSIFMVRAYWGREKLNQELVAKNQDIEKAKKPH